ncbi:MAG: hypothetical protein WCF59_06055 [Desulfobaccales bacterium]|jgi:hypothetical protein
MATAELAAKDESPPGIRGGLDAAREVALSQGERVSISGRLGTGDCLTIATRLPQAIWFLAAGNGLVARGVPFLLLDGANKVGFPKPGVILHPQDAGFLYYLIHRHGKSPYWQ